MSHAQLSASTVEVASVASQAGHFRRTGLSSTAGGFGDGWPSFSLRYLEERGRRRRPALIAGRGRCYRLCPPQGSLRIENTQPVAHPPPQAVYSGRTHCATCATGVLCARARVLVGILWRISGTSGRLFDAPPATIATATVERSAEGEWREQHGCQAVAARAASERVMTTTAGTGGGSSPSAARLHLAKL